MKQSLYIMLSLLCLNFFSFVYPQEHFTTGTGNHQQGKKCSKVFSEISKGIADHNIDAIARYFSPQTYLSLSNGTSGYYSSNQAYYVLEDFFKIYRVTAFRFDNIQTGSNNPYATGEYQFEYRGKRDIASVYIALKQAGKDWKITQITIN